MTPALWTMDHVLANTDVDSRDNFHNDEDVAKMSSEVENFFFTDLPPPESRFSSAAGYGLSSEREKEEMVLTDSSLTTVTTRDSPDFGDFRFAKSGDRNGRRHSSQDSSKSPTVGIITSSLSRVARFCRSPSRPNPTKKVTALPPSVLIIKQMSPEKGAATYPIKIPPRRGKTRSLPLPAGSPDEEDIANEHLRKLYDTRTWDMYMRITEARKNQRHHTNTVHIQHASYVNASAHGNGHFLCSLPDGSTGMMPQDSSQQYSGDLPDHEMIFGDLE
jgi:hypothetical protein